MTHNLPRPIAQKLQQTLAQWRHWHCEPPLQREPDIVAVLTAGISNHSILVQARQQYVVRIDGVSPTSNGLNRQTEWRALQAAHRAGLAPGPRYFNPDLGSLVCDYLEHDERQLPDMQDTARLLRAIHQLPARHHRLDLAERILRYEKQLEHRGRPLPSELQGAGSAVSALLQDLKLEDAGTTLCHNDLLRANRIYSGGRLWAIDWEYAAMTSPWYDLAVVAHGDALSPADTDELLQAYLGRTPREEEELRLRRYGCVYRYLELLWYLALERPVLDEAALAQRSAALCAMLDKL